jgi:hypothetical protein
MMNNLGEFPEIDPTIWSSILWMEIGAIGELDNNQGFLNCYMKDKITAIMTKDRRRECDNCKRDLNDALAGRTSRPFSLNITLSKSELIKALRLFKVYLWLKHLNKVDDVNMYRDVSPYSDRYFEDKELAFNDKLGYYITTQKENRGKK